MVPRNPWAGPVLGSGAPFQDRFYLRGGVGVVDVRSPEGCIFRPEMVRSDPPAIVRSVGPITVTPSVGPTPLIRFCSMRDVQQGCTRDTRSAGQLWLASRSVRLAVPTVNPRLCSGRPRISRVAGRTEFTVESVADQVDSWGKQSLEGKRVVTDGWGRSITRPEWC